MKHGKLLPLLVILSAITLAAPALAEDHGAPDSIYFKVPNPPTQPGTFAVELWMKNDADTLVGISAGFRWTNDNLVLDSAKPASDMWDTNIFYDTNRDITNEFRHFLYVGVGVPPTTLVQPSPSARHAATFYFTLSSWLPGDEIVIDTNEFQVGAELAMGTQHGTYVPRFGDPVRLTYSPWDQHSWYVATGGDDDTGMGTIESPFRTIQFAINWSSDGDSVIVAPGTYYENIVFGGKNILVGSYYVLVDNDTTPGSTIIDGSMLTRGDSTGSVVSIVDGETDASVIGFTIRGGIGQRYSNPEMSAYSYAGGGVIVQNSSATLAHNIIDSNSLSGGFPRGGGIYVEQGSIRLIDNRIQNNLLLGRVDNNGGGVCVAQSPNSELTGNTIENNGADGIAFIGDEHGIAEQNRIVGNAGHGIYITDKGDHFFRNNTILDNDSAGIYANNAHPHIEGNVIARNRQGIVSRASSLEIVRNTVAYNATTESGGGFYHFLPNLSVFTLENNIFWGNTAGSGTAEITIADRNAALEVSCCDIEGGLDAVSVVDGASFTWHDNNIDLNPGFCDSFLDDYHISSSSPCRPDAAENLCGTLIGAVGVGCGSTPGGRTWHVMVDGSGDVPTIQAAVDSALAGDTILVGPGVYTGPGNTDVFVDAFKLIRNGGNSLLITSQDGPSETIMDAQGNGRGFFVQGPLDFNMTIDGFTFRHGSTGEVAGGAIRCFGVAALISGCVFYDNECNYGGAIYFNGYETPSGALSTPAPRVVGCTFFNNRALIGSAIYIQYNSLALSVERSIFMANHSTRAFPPVTTLDGYAGGATVTLSCCDIYGNQGGNWIGMIADQANVQGNFSADPIFCDPAAGSFSIHTNSPCALGASPCGELVGARGVGCATVEIRTWYVDVHGSDSTGDGTFDKPFATIQHAIGMSKDFDTVQVAKGTYYGNGNRDMIFQGRKIVVRSEAGHENTTIDCRADPDEYPGYHRAFIFRNDEQSNSIIDGFRIIHGTADDSLSAANGGAILCDDMASPTIRNCLFAQNNCSGMGGAVFAHQGALDVTGCIFDHNHAEGGGALATLGGGFTVDQCEFRSNVADRSGSAIFANGAYTIQLQNSVFYRNSCGDQETVVTLIGGLTLSQYTPSYKVIGCTFVDNIADPLGQSILVTGTDLLCERSIFAFNGGRAVWCVQGDAVMQCCDVYNNLGGDWVGCIKNDSNNKSNFSMDPLFCNRGTHDYHIDAASPCAPANTWCGDLVGALGVGCSSGSRIVWYVDPNGSDVSGDGSPESPFATIQHAIDMSTGGDSVFVRPGTYEESLNYLGKNITVRSIEGPMQTRIINERTVNLVTFENGENADAVLEGFTLEGGWMAILCINSGPTIRHNVLANQNVTNWAAIALTGTPAIAQDPNGDPRYCPTVGTSPAVIVNNTIVNTANGGISTFSSTAPTIWNNIVAFTDHYGMHREGIMPGVAYPLLGYNDVYGCPVAYQELPDHGPGSIEADPMFGRHFSLSPGSPCIDAGDPDPAFNDPDGTRNDMGANPAIENVAVTPTDKWINVYCTSPMIDGAPLPQSAILRAFDPDGVLCGIGTLRKDYSFGFIPIYHDDIYTDADEGAVEGDLISFTVNDQAVTVDPPIYWTENGDSFEACQFSTERCLALELHQGWNLVSWNVGYSEDIVAAIDGIRDCVDVVMSFDRGGLTYDPELAQFSTLQSVDYQHGYWFRMNCDATLEICGQDIMRHEVLDLVPGWNLVSYWPQQVTSLDQGFQSVLDHLLVATAFDNGVLTWVRDLEQFSTLTELEPGMGYWIKTDAYVPLVYPGFMVPIIQDSESSGAATDQEPASRYWISAYGEDMTVDDVAVPQGALFEFYTEDGTLCGQGDYGDGRLNFTSIYGSDDITEASRQYAGHGATVIVKVDGVRVYPDLRWANNGDRVRIGKLSTSADGLPTSYALGQNYPNPFNPGTMIDYALPNAGHVTLEIFNVLGQEVRTLVNEFNTAGLHTVEWDGRSNDGATVSTGIYLYRIQASEFTQTRKMILVK